jgi:hypothetical protein
MSVGEWREEGAPAAAPVPGMYACGDEGTTSERREQVGVEGVGACRAGLETRDTGATKRKLVVGHGGGISGR